MGEPKPPEPPTIANRVGAALFDDHRFCGFSVRSELAGRDGFWSTASLALGGPRLSESESTLLDDLATGSLSADPRIWPLKICRLLSAYGRFEPGFAGTFIAIAGGAVGPPAIAQAARLLLELSEELGDGWQDDAALSRALDERLKSGAPLAGFGTPYRSTDERLTPITAAVERAGCGDRKFWQLMGRTAELVRQRKGLAVNAGAALGAACLDLGFDQRQVAALAILLLLNNTVANAYEGAVQAPEVLRRIPDDFVRYVGPPPRRSPRFEQAAKRAATGRAPGVT